MFARGQVQGGDGGLLSVGNPLRVEYREAKGKTVSQSLPPNTQVKYLALRDIQLAVPHGLRPAAAKGEQAQWINGEIPDYDSTACTDPKAWFVPGACGHDGISSGGTTDTKHDLVWLFTVNGHHFPEITETPKTPQLWRLANLSSNPMCLRSQKDPNQPPMPRATILRHYARRRRGRHSRRERTR